MNGGEHGYEVTEYNPFWKRALFISILVAAVATLALTALFPNLASRLVTTSGILFDLGGVLQLAISGVFDKWMKHLGDTEVFPFGPPSSMTMQFTEDPDKPVRAWLRDLIWFNTQTGFG